jgi:glyoxylase-like metal-dependent hydrolase (beta-lactamase superfamily II)
VSEDGPRPLGHGIHVIPVPLPFPGLRWVNSFVIEGDDDITMIDCGVNTSEGRAAISAGLSALGFADAPVGRLIGTHLHVDHVGVAPRLVADSGWRLVMHERVPSLIDRYNDPARFVRKTAAMATRHGAPPDEVAELATMEPVPDYYLPAEPPAETVADGDRIALGTDRDLEVLHTPGHEAAHICLRDSRTGVLFAGDHLLPRITPVIMWRDEDDDPLGDYLDGLERLVGMDAGLTYPAHGVAIDRGAARAAQIKAHHRRRLDDAAELLATGPMTAWTMMGRLFRPHLITFEKRLALRETLSHLEHLRRVGRIESFTEDGVIWYRQA